MKTYAFDGFDPLGPHGGFVAIVEDILGTDEMLVLTRIGEKVAVIIDVNEYEALVAAARNGGDPQC